MKRQFLKMNGLGNDFVIFDSRKDGFIPDADACRKLADRRRGVGCDQIIVMDKPDEAGFDAFMRVYNADGSDAGTCGNATRCVASLLFQENGEKEVRIKTTVGRMTAWPAEGGMVSVDMGEPRTNWNEIPLAAECDTLSVNLSAGELSDPCCVSMGNPHAVFFVKDAAAVPLETLGPKLEHDRIFPKRCNIEAAQVIMRDRIRMRVWERGTGITEACGTGACATAVAAARRGLCDRRSTVVLDGGELSIEWRESDGHVIMTGGADLSFYGMWEKQ